MATQQAVNPSQTIGLNPTIEAQNLINQMNSSPYSGQNVLSAVQGTVPTYNYTDPYGARTSIEERLGLGTATKEEQAAQASLLGFQDDTRAQINALRANRDLSTGLEAGFEAQRTREASQQEQVLANILNLAQNKRMALESRVAQEYDIYQRERAKRESAMLDAMQYGANVNIGMSLEDIVKAGTKAREKYEKKTAEDKYKQDLKSTAIQLGLKTSGKTKDLEKRIKNYYKEQGASEKEMKEIERKIKLKSLSGGGGGNSKEDLVAEGTAGLNSFFDQVKGQDGYVSPSDWAEAKSQWSQNNLSTSSFNAIFGKWKNPNDKYI